MKRAHSIYAMLCSVILSCSAPSEKLLANETNIKRVAVGMNLKQMNAIMGKPDEIRIYTFNDLEFDFIYPSPPKYDDDFHVYFLRQDSTVLRIVNGE